MPEQQRLQRCAIAFLGMLDEVSVRLIVVGDFGEWVKHGPTPWSLVDVVILQEPSTFVEIPFGATICTPSRSASEAAWLFAFLPFADIPTRVPVWVGFRQ
jgi:hypothetical protein